jgi:hypothetical protein
MRSLNYATGVVDVSEKAETELNRILHEIESTLIEAAKNESLVSRGEPIEITARDVDTAYKKLLTKSSPERKSFFVDLNRNFKCRNCQAVTRKGLRP